MRVWRLLLGLTIGLLSVAYALGPAQSVARPRHHRGPIYRDRSYTPAERAADLVARMSLREKAAEMISGDAPAIGRLGLKRYSWWSEAAHGVSGHQEIPGEVSDIWNATVYPTDLALGSSWDPGLMYREASAISDEAREIAPEQYRDLSFFAPTVNLSRDPRWGRNDETFSEDPFLTAAMASQYVNGLQGQDQSGRLLDAGGGYLKAIATLKHYAANNDEHDRITGSSNVDERTLREYYTAQFAQIIAQSQPGSMMSSYNEVNGTPAAANLHLMDTLARKTFGFGGYFSSDCDSIDSIVNGHHWQAPGYSRPLNETEAHAVANATGEDLNCNLFYTPLDYRALLPAASAEAIHTPADTYSVNDMDVSLERLFTARMQTGEFDNTNAEPWVRQARAQLHGARWTDSPTNGAITETPSRLALAQESADKAEVLLRNSVIRRRDGTVGPLLPIRVPPDGPFKVAVIGHEGNRYPLWLGGYSSQQDGAGVGNEVSPYAGIKAEIQSIDPSAQVDFYDGFQGGDPADTLQQIDPNAISAAAGYDYVIVDVGTDWTTSGEGFDRSTLALPGAQAQLIGQVAQANPNTILVMQTGGAVDLSSATPVPAIVWSSFNGQREGLGLADVLLDRYNPSGHLPFTWYASDSELPSITDYAIRPGAGSPGRTYMYFRGPVSFPFGHGLSYTTFSVSPVGVNSTRLTADDTLRTSVRVTNTGSLPGEDLVQLYIATPGVSGVPVKRLEGFQQIYLNPHQTGTVSLAVPIARLAFWEGSRDAVRDGLYQLQVANSAAPQDVLAARDFHVRGSLTPVPSVVTPSPQMPGDANRGIRQRLLFPVGTTVEPRLTVAMNDSSLYGYGSGRPLPAGARVSYSSDNPAVVSVAGGTIRTLASGVASVTAAVFYHHMTAHGQFVVRALSELGRIDVTIKPRGRGAAVTNPVPGFHPDTFSYDMTVPQNARVPKLTATSPDSGAHVTVVQAARVPGIGRIEITGPDGISHTYAIYFARPPRSFAGRIGRQWTWIRLDPGSERLAGGSVQIALEPGALNDHSARNVLVEPALGDWTITSRLSLATPPAVGQQAGIMAYQDDGNYLELALGPGRQLVLTATDDLSGTTVSQVLASYPFAGSTVWLRIAKSGAHYGTYFATDGVHYAPIYNVGAALAGTKVGLFAFGAGGGTASFGFFDVRSRSLH